MKYKYPITNNLVFAMVMEDPKICKGFIQRTIPGRKVKEIRAVSGPESEKTVIVYSWNFSDRNT